MRNLRNCPSGIKATCYTTLVRPTLEYACPVWDPHRQGDISRLEKVQKRAARFVTGNYIFETGNSEINRQKLGWETLEERRQQIKLTTFQKARLNLLDVPTDHLKFNTRRSRRQEGPCYTHQHSFVDSHKFSFYPSSTLLWNHLPCELKSCTDIEFFSTTIKNFDLSAHRFSSYTQSRMQNFN